jgi:hypothetical protein
MRIFIVVKFNCSKFRLNSKLGINNRDPYSTTNCLKRINTRKGEVGFVPTGQDKRWLNPLLTFDLKWKMLASFESVTKENWQIKGMRWKEDDV